MFSASLFSLHRKNSLFSEVRKYDLVLEIFTLCLLYVLQVIEEVDDDDGEEEEEEAEEEDAEEEGELVPGVSSDDGEISPVNPQRGAATSQSKKFASLSALESRPSRAEEVCLLVYYETSWTVACLDQ